MGFGALKEAQAGGARGDACLPSGEELGLAASTVAISFAVFANSPLPRPDILLLAGFGLSVGRNHGFWRLPPSPPGHQRKTYHFTGFPPGASGSASPLNHLHRE